MSFEIARVKLLQRDDRILDRRHDLFYYISRWYIKQTYSICFELSLANLENKSRLVLPKTRSFNEWMSEDYCAKKAIRLRAMAQ